MFAQIHYQAKLGNSNLTLAEAGCFITANSNILAKVGITIDPPTLDNFYQSHNLFSYDATDHANDDITWSTVTHYCPQLVVAQTGLNGFPTSDLAIVEFRYKDHTGQEVTHFCAVNSASDHSIIDSWDGKVKLPAEYEHVYGQPIAWATYNYHTVQTIPVETPPAAPVSAPKAVAPAPQPPAPSAPKELYLPPSISVWHVYNPGGPWTLPHAIHVLDPKMFGGLTYQILGSPAPNIYLIHTQDFGEVAIYAGPDTVAQFPGSGHGEGESTDATPPATGIPVSEVVPAPTTAPVEPAITYAKFDNPMSLVTKDGAQSVNFVSGAVVDNFSAGTPFEAVGKATLANNDTYYMDENSFGIADQTQRTPITVGIKTVYLTEAPKAETPDTTAHTGMTSTITLNTASTPITAPALNTTASWQGTMHLLPEPVKYVVTEDLEVYNFATGNDELSVPKGTVVTVAGTFIFNGRRYYRSQSGVDKGTWYGFPVTSLKRQDATNTPFNTGDDIDQIGNEIQQEVKVSKAKHGMLKAAGTSSGWLSRLKISRSRAA